MKWYWNRAFSRGHLWDGTSFNGKGYPVAVCHKVTPLYPKAPSKITEPGYKRIPKSKKCRFCIKIEGKFV